MFAIKRITQREGGQKLNIYRKHSPISKFEAVLVSEVGHHQTSRCVSELSDLGERGQMATWISVAPNGRTRDFVALERTLD